MNDVTAIAKQIQLLILDVDGVLTDGQIYYSANGDEIKAFHIHDGWGIRALIRSGISIAVITGRKSALTKRRADELNIPYYFEGQQHKLDAYGQLKDKLQLTDQQIAYVGDDILDLPVMRKVGLPVAVQNAVKPVQAVATWHTTKSGGNGAVREVCELIMNAQGTLETQIEHHL